jgi:hypothetical protein
MRSLVFASLLALSTNCASVQRTSRTKALERTLQNHVYSQSPEAILAVAKDMLTQRGFPAEAAYVNSFETDHRTIAAFGQQMNVTSTSNYRVSAVVVDGGTRVTIFKKTFVMSAGTIVVGSTNTERDYELELELLRVLSPPTATQIDTLIVSRR